jgi:hypothetical protein
MVFMPQPIKHGPQDLQCWDADQLSFQFANHGAHSLGTFEKHAHWGSALSVIMLL